MKKLFFFFHLVKHIRKRTIQTGRLFFSSSLKLDAGQIFNVHPQPLKGSPPTIRLRVRALGVGEAFLQN